MGGAWGRGYCSSSSSSSSSSSNIWRKVIKKEEDRNVTTFNFRREESGWSLGTRLANNVINIPNAPFFLSFLPTHWFPSEEVVYA